MNEKSYIFDETGDASELHRLETLEGVFDPATRRRLLSTGLRAGWRCLEVGAGAGSIARWMSDTVGPFGKVVAVDVNTRFLSRIAGPNLEVCEADIREAPIDAESFDVAHARFVLIHVPNWREVIAAMLACLKPGGWLVLEEPDFSSSRSFAGRPELQQAFGNVHQAIHVMFRQRGFDHAFGARLPSAFQERELQEISIEGDTPIVPGGSAFARMMGMSTLQLRDKYVATGFASERDIELYGTFSADPTCWATYHATIAAIGRKPASFSGAATSQSAAEPST